MTDSRRVVRSVVPLVLVLDTSLSMQGEPIEVVIDILARTADEFHRNPSFKYTVRVAMITFGFDGVVLWCGNRRISLDDDPFVDAADWQPPKLHAEGVTPLADAVKLAVECVEGEKQRLRDAQRLYNRPVIWLWSDGMPTNELGDYDDSWRDLIPKLSRSERRFRLYALYPPRIPPEGQATLLVCVATRGLRLRAGPAAPVGFDKQRLLRTGRARRRDPAIGSRR
jgi:uncharacterized protein YegL